MRHGLILVFLAVQLVVPLRYYTCGHRYDERFAWRMFSPIRMVRCQVEFTDEREAKPQPIRLSAEVSQPWAGWMKRGHTRVVRAFGRRWCATHAAIDGQLRLTVAFTCRLPDGHIDTPISPSENLCDP